jgi:hypothetical protein
MLPTHEESMLPVAAHAALLQYLCLAAHMSTCMCAVVTGELHTVQYVTTALAA